MECKRVASAVQLSPVLRPGSDQAVGHLLLTAGSWHLLLTAKPEQQSGQMSGQHIVPFGKFHRIGGTPPETFPNVRYDAPKEVGGNNKCFDSPIRKLGLVQVLGVNSSRALTLCS